ncbi:hypothetical protein [Candidatus Villigracilis affinis]|uniref:hypothetical protein n=1 Tax=Candidatus Villigracilis affinis TaxID=3140682 RepID=UPI0031E5453C
MADGRVHQFQGLEDRSQSCFCLRDFKITGKPDSEIAEIQSFPLDALPAGLWPGHVRRLEEYKMGQANPQFGEW